jgi:hypothetical protein
MRVNNVFYPSLFGDRGTLSVGGSRRCGPWADATAKQQQKEGGSVTPLHGSSISFAFEWPGHEIDDRLFGRLVFVEHPIHLFGDR